MTDPAAPDRPARKVRIGDVAAAAGVSVGTVSNVINGRGNVSAKRRALVEQAIKDLAFSGSLLAKGMRTQRLPVVGLCVPNATSANFVMMSDAIEGLTAAAGFEMVQVITRHDPQRERLRIERLIASRASGVMLLPSGTADGLLARLADEGVPTVAINHFAGTPAADHVFVDHRAALRGATERLVAGGYSELIAVTQFPDFAVVKENIAGLHEGAGAAPEATVDVLRMGQDREEFRDILLRRLALRRRRAAVIAMSGPLAAWTLAALRDGGLACPADIGLLCAEEPDWALALSPAMSCIRQPTQDLARTAWQMLSARIAGDDGPPRQERCLAEVTLRGSLLLR